MTRKLLFGGTSDWKVSLGLSGGFAIVLGLSLAVPVDVCIVGGLGDVSRPLRTTWTLGTGLATFLSFGLAVRSYRAEAGDSSADGDDVGDSNTAIHVEGVEGDVDLNVTVSTEGQTRGDESDDLQVNESEDSASGTDREETEDEEAETADDADPT